jgi:hypothetical protein
LQTLTHPFAASSWIWRPTQPEISIPPGGNVDSFSCALPGKTPKTKTAEHSTKEVGFLRSIENTFCIPILQMTRAAGDALLELACPRHRINYQWLKSKLKPDDP